MSDLQPQLGAQSAHTFRIDVQLHELLTSGPRKAHSLPAQRGADRRLFWTNLDDVQQLTKIAHDNGIATGLGHREEPAGIQDGQLGQASERYEGLLARKVEPWNCRAGQNSITIPSDGSLAPRFPMYSATQDWGTIKDPKFDVRQLNEMKKTCQTQCFSTLNYNLGFCYNDSRVDRWVMQRAKRGFQGVAGSFA